MFSNFQIAKDQLAAARDVFTRPAASNEQWMHTLQDAGEFLSMVAPPIKDPSKGTVRYITNPNASIAAQAHRHVVEAQQLGLRGLTADAVQQLDKALSVLADAV
jgi:hypothetical protein